MSTPNATALDDYRTTDIDHLRVDRPLPCDVFLYFEKNQHLLLWKTTGFVFPEGSLDGYIAKGLKKVWVHKNDIEAFQMYLAPERLDPLPGEPVLEAAPVTESEIEITARYLLSLLRSAQYEDRLKRALVAKAVRILLGKAIRAGDLEEQTRENKKLQGIVYELLKRINSNESSPLYRVIQQMWFLINAQRELCHSANVTAYAVLIAMTFGRIDEELISDIAISALCHDVGTSQLSMSVGTLDHTKMTAAQSAAYTRHVPATLELFTLFVGDVPSRVSLMVEQVHERFDGTGYPHRKRGAEIHDGAQVIAMADLLVGMSSGQWDGTQRTFNDAITLLEEQERQAAEGQPGSVQYFKPDTITAVARWIRESQKKLA
jgi:HD-GYP domain-containing protein (c-di-GMP phosphodiesterase class II)